ncbi:hypothetical protein KHM83_03815 [Fusibacter paucivorans]|uniref:Uncharacterized protein n=1 Tax=Fusibacter paucivorans TaxID=76009 RepID=A0ABS5PKV2_9FIRM|nr:hypothetical protein [Fusibacter paucivorans]MBS7525800.1 hypothetical protein [Fusibacter paucivorans]
MHNTFKEAGHVYTFSSARATDTRLMGVVGLEIYWTSANAGECLQIFHLDYESYGIDGYHQFFRGDPEEIERVRSGITGGLGGRFISLTFEEALALIAAARDVDPDSTTLLVDFEWFEHSLNQTLPEEVLESATRVLMPERLTDISAINYFLMRLIGCDNYGASMLFKGDQAAMASLTDYPCTLLKNTVTPLMASDISDRERRYEASALIDFEEKYRLMVLTLTVSGENKYADGLDQLPKGDVQISSVSIKESLTVSSIEASFNLNKPEYMLVLHAKDSFLERRFERSNPELMKQAYRGGNLYLEYNSDNHHVSENPYYLNGDLYAAYFFALSGQVVIASFEQAHIAEIDQQFHDNGIYEHSLSFVCELRTDLAVTFSFAQSAFDNIFDFLDHHAF